MERKIGEQFTDNGVLLEVVKSITCEGCYYETQECDEKKPLRGNCVSTARVDITPVIFKQVEEKQ